MRSSAMFQFYITKHQPHILLEKLNKEYVVFFLGLHLCSELFEIIHPIRKRLPMFPHDKIKGNILHINSVSMFVMLLIH